MKTNRLTLLFAAAAITLGAPAATPSIARAPAPVATAGYAVGAQYDTTHVYVDAADFDSAVARTYSRPDTSETLKQAHAALAHDRWLRDQVGQALKEADDPSTQWVSNEAAMAEGAKRRAAWRARSASAVTKGKGSPV